MRNTVRKKLIASIIVVAIMLLQSTVFATGGQANGTSGALYSKTVSYFFELVRSMETETGTLAKASNIETEHYVDSSANGIDCHLEKNTEYGTVTLLAASIYGYPKSNAENDSTGKYKSGVFNMTGSWEYVANTLQESPTSAKILKNGYNNALVNADSRYVDEYTSTTKYSIPGDGIIETDGWGGDTNFVATSYPVFVRGVGGFFGYGSHGGVAYTSYGARAVVVCGPGL